MVGPEWVRTYTSPLSDEHLAHMSGKQEGTPNLDFLSIVEGGQKLKYFYNRLLHKKPI